MVLCCLTSFSGDLFLVITDKDFEKYANDNTPHRFGNDVKEVSSNFEIASEKILFRDNQMKVDPDKCHLLFSTDEQTKKIRNSKCQKLIGLNIDCRVAFHADLNEIYRKAGHTLFFYKNQ